MPGSRLCLGEREEIRAGLERGDSFREIARAIGRSVSTVTREVSRNRSYRGYVAHLAERRARWRARRPRRSVLDPGTRLHTLVKERLELRLSPMVIARQLHTEGYRVSHETIYQAIHRDTFGDPRRVLCRPRRYRRRHTRTGRDPHPLGHIKLVQQRNGDPSTEAGHWEGDLIVGKQNRTVAVVLTERASRYVLFGALLQGRNSDHVTEVVATLLEQIPPTLRKTLCWDQGRELTRWPKLEDQLGIDVFFCEPRSPWQKPLVENVCGLARRWLPHNQPITHHQTTLDNHAQLLNTMPRRSLNWNTATNTLNTMNVATTT